MIQSHYLGCTDLAYLSIEGSFEKLGANFEFGGTLLETRLPHVPRAYRACARETRWRRVRN